MQRQVTTCDKCFKELQTWFVFTIPRMKTQGPNYTLHFCHNCFDALHDWIGIRGL